MEDRSRTCCFTGHREIKPAHYQLMNRVILHAIKVLYKRGYRSFLTGGAVGFDTAAAKAVLSARDYVGDIELILILPCKDQTKMWRESDIAIYNEILTQANHAIYTSETYTKDCMFIRNQALVDNSSYCVSYQFRSGGGTAYTVNYARSQGITVYNTATRIEELIRKAE